MNKLKIISILFLLVIIATKSYSKENIFIVYNINEKLITNIDLKKESSYLIALNNQLKKLDKKKILEIAEDSIVREAVKEIELNKFFDLNKKIHLLKALLKTFI